MTIMTEQEANEKISKLLQCAYDAIRQAEQIADEAGVGFAFDVSYGMGGWYTSRKQAARENDIDLDANPDWEPSDESYVGWQASSQSC